MNKTLKVIQSIISINIILTTTKLIFKIILTIITNVYWGYNIPDTFLVFYTTCLNNHVMEML